MPWQANGHYYSFKSESIEARVPAISGVYGLYNIKRQIFIGESADIRGALLHHEKTPGFRIKWHRPTGFTFELCPPEIRAQRAQELIAEYRPALQTRAAFAPWQRRRHNPFESHAAVSKNGASQNGKVLIMMEETEEKARRFSFRRDQLAVVALALVMTTAIIMVLRTLNGEEIFGKRSIATMISTPQPSLEPVDQSLESPLPAQLAQSEPDRAPYSYLAEENKSQAPENAPSSEHNTSRDNLRREISEVKTAGKGLAATALAKVADPATDNKLQIPAASPQVSAAPKRNEPGKTWTVQIKSSLDKASADAWAQQLRSKGYEAFVIETAIKERTWYRIRVGQFDNQREADTLRNTLASTEGFRDAFVAK